MLPRHFVYFDASFFIQTRRRFPPCVVFLFSQGGACFLDRGAKDRKASTSGEAKEEEGLSLTVLLHVALGRCWDLAGGVVVGAR